MANSRDGLNGEAGRALRILILDDEHDTANSLAHLLRLFRYEVQIAYDGLSALKAAQTLPPDVVILDIAMPGMSGFEVAKQLRAQDSPKRHFIIALSGYQATPYTRETKEADIDLYLLKPADPEQLLGLLKKFRDAAGRG